MFGCGILPALRREEWMLEQGGFSVVVGRCL